MFYCEVGQHKTAPRERRHLVVVEVRRVVNLHKDFSSAGLEIQREIPSCGACLPLAFPPIEVGSKTVAHKSPKQVEPPATHKAGRF